MIQEFQKYFQEKIIDTRKLKHTGNNQLFEIVTEQENYLLKKYSTIQKDNWNRGKTEFRAISFLSNKGFEVPNPFSFQDNIGIYSFENGRKKQQNEITEKDIIHAADFLARMHSFPIEDKKKFPLERTACLSSFDYINLIENRFESLKEDFAGGKNEEKFIYKEVRPRMQEIKKGLLYHINLKKKLSLEEQVITPGDFGFHNILINPKEYIFLDFEYCGRDNPTKQILDFLHHDKTKEISRELKEAFLNHYRKKAPITDDFEKRLKQVDSLIGMNWILIYLNPLSKKYQEHMQFSNKDIDIQEVIKERMKKAEAKLNNINYFN